MVGANSQKSRRKSSGSYAGLAVVLRDAPDRIRDAESQTIEDNQIASHEATKNQKIWARKYFISRLAELSEQFKKTTAPQSYEILKISHNLWNIYMATKLDLDSFPRGGDQRDVILATMKACLRRVQNKEKYWDIKLLSPACYPEVATSELCTHVGLTGFLETFEVDAGRDFQDVQGQLRSLILDGRHVTEARLRLLNEGLRKLYPDRNHWRPLLQLGTSPATTCRMTRPLILLFCYWIDQVEKEHEGKDVSEDLIHSLIERSILHVDIVPPAVMSYDRFLGRDRLQLVQE
ncbi:hypothetical protein BDZ45DRAFT_746276 [Acephala macrosclerotiorum]|nr:hypothetical protein BDZ45DRAFT_746276 [Acephala macrosclerotiorum]